MNTSKHITITSKNQITIPADFVRRLQLHKDRTMKATIKNGSIVLAPTKDLSNDMQKYWDKRDQNACLSDSQLKNATRRIISKRATR